MVEKIPNPRLRLHVNEDEPAAAMPLLFFKRKIMKLFTLLRNLSAIVTFVSQPFSCDAKQNWLLYYDLINRAEEEFVMNHQPEKSFPLYDSAFSIVNRPFVSDVYVAAEVAFYAKDTNRFMQYIGTCFDRGMTFQCLHFAKLFEGIFRDPQLIGSVQSRFDHRMLFPVDTVLRDTIYFHKYREQMVKKKLGRNREGMDEMHAIARENVAYFNTFLDKGVFPSEQMIGLYTEDNKEAFFTRYNLPSYEVPIPKSLTAGNNSMAITGVIPDDYELANNAALYSYLHYPCGFEMSREKFWQAVLNGYVHLKDYCMMEEWFAQSFGNQNYEHDCTEHRKACYYNIYWELRVNDAEGLAQVEKNRAAMHLPRFAVDVKKRKMKKENGMEFFFGFLFLR